jgi:hypothetical protein
MDASKTETTRRVRCPERFSVRRLVEDVAITAAPLMEPGERM